MPPGCAALQIDNLDPFGPQRVSQTVMLRLQLFNRINLVTAPIPALALGISIGAQMLKAHFRVDDLHLVAGTVHQHLPQLADIIVAAPVAAPDFFLLCRALEGWFGM